MITEYKYQSSVDIDLKNIFTRFSYFCIDAENPGSRGTFQGSDYYYYYYYY